LTVRSTIHHEESIMALSGTVRGQDLAVIVAAELGKYPNITDPGRAYLTGAWSDLANRAPSEMAKEVAKRMESGLGKAHINPEYVEPKLANGADKSPIRRALEMEQGRLRPNESIEPLVEALGGRAARMDFPTIRTLVVEHLDRRDADARRQGARNAPLPPVPPPERAVRDTPRRGPSF
jgi:hypothetical protein